MQKFYLSACFFLISNFALADDNDSFSRTITADSAMLDEKNHLINLDQNVRSSNPDGISFHAEHAEVKYDSKFNNLEHAELSGKVRIKTQKDRLKAEKIVFNGNTVHCSVPKFNYRKNDFCLLITKDLKLISEKLSATVDNKKISTVDAVNHVYILYNGSLIRADSATMDTKKNTVILKKNIVVLDHKKNLIKCNYCRINLKERKYYVSGKINGEITI